MDWIEKLYHLAKDDENWLSWQAELQKREHEYERILEMLPPEQQEFLRDYISVYQEAEYALVSIAYELGSGKSEKAGG